MNNFKGSVLVAVTNDISTDQRIRKVSEYLTKKDFQVINYGRVLNDTFPINTNYKIIRKKHFFNQHVLFYAEYNIRLLFYILFNKFDIIFSNDLDTLPACFIGSKLKRVKLIYDSHEYFTEVPELQNRFFVRSIWQFIEKILLPFVHQSITVSKSIAEAYKNKYNVNMLVIRNLPQLNSNFEPAKIIIPTNNKIILYQGVLNPGRGLERIIKALKQLDNIDLLIVGFGKVENELKKFVKKMGMDSRVHFVGRVPHNQLLNYSKISHIGMVLEEPLGKSFEYSLPNKLFDFIHAELPILGSPNKEIKNLIETYKVGYVINNFSIDELKKGILKLLYDTNFRNQLIKNQQQVKKDLCWENEVSQLDVFL